MEQVLRQPALKLHLNPKDLGGTLCLYFDGGCQTLDGSKQGAGGFIALGADGYCLGGMGKFYGLDAVTNNQAEALGLVDALKWLGSQPNLVAH